MPIHPPRSKIVTPTHLNGDANSIENDIDSFLLGLIDTTLQKFEALLKVTEETKIDLALKMSIINGIAKAKNDVNESRVLFETHRDEMNLKEKVANAVFIASIKATVETEARMLLEVFAE